MIYTLPEDDIYVAQRENFLRVFANLPIALRKEIIAVIDDKPISWEVAYIEVSNNTKLGEAILKKLSEWRII